MSEESSTAGILIGAVALIPTIVLGLASIYVPDEVSDNLLPLGIGTSFWMFFTLLIGSLMENNRW